jgi:hypothetical protein
MCTVLPISMAARDDIPALFAKAKQHIVFQILIPFPPERVRPPLYPRHGDRVVEESNTFNPRPFQVLERLISTAESSQAGKRPQISSPDHLKRLMVNELKVGRILHARMEW